VYSAGEFHASQSTIAVPRCRSCPTASYSGITDRLEPCLQTGMELPSNCTSHSAAGSRFRLCFPLRCGSTTLASIQASQCSLLPPQPILFRLSAPLPCAVQIAPGSGGVLRSWIEKHGIPGRCTRIGRTSISGSPQKENDCKERRATTQFGRMCERLEIRIIAANSPQAKGRVERNNGVHQDRLVKKLRRQGDPGLRPRMRIWKRNIFLSTTDDLREKRRDPRTTTCGRPVRRGCERFFD